MNVDVTFSEKDCGFAPEFGEVQIAGGGGGDNFYDTFWDAFQQNGEKEDYYYAFAGNNWTADILKPKYPIRPNDHGRNWSYEGARLFTKFHSAERWDWSKMGITLDMSNVSYPDELFANAGITNIDVDLSSALQLNQTFVHSNCSCDHGDLSIRLKVSEQCAYSLPFNYCSKFVSIIFADGSVIGNSGIDVSYAKRLSHESLMSMINALKDYSGTGTTKSITFGTENLAKLTDAEKAIATQKGWTLA